ncbi:MAG: universal stress protein [Bacteroidales bacterium]
MATPASDRNNIVLVPTDFTPVGQNAIEHAATVAKVLNFKVVVLHVINRESRTAFGGKNALKAVEEKLSGIVKDIKARYKVEAEYIFREGSIFDVIHEVASEIKANVMILGTHGKKGIQHITGSYAMKVITQSPVPVIVVQKRKIGQKGYQKIVFPISLYTESRQQVFYAIVNSVLFNSDILIFRQKCTDPGEHSKLEIITGQIEKEFKKNNVSYTLEEAAGTRNFAGQLLDYAVSNSADMIMMMTDSNIDNPSFDNSAWSEKLIYNVAQIPVMSINPVYLGQIYFTF